MNIGAQLRAGNSCHRRSRSNADWLITAVPISGTLSQLLPGQIHLLVAQGGNTSQPAVEYNNTLTGQ